MCSGPLLIFLHNTSELVSRQLVDRIRDRVCMRRHCEAHRSWPGVRLGGHWEDIRAERASLGSHFLSCNPGACVRGMPRECQIKFPCYNHAEMWKRLQLSQVLGEKFMGSTLHNPAPHSAGNRPWLAPIARAVPKYLWVSINMWYWLGFCGSGSLFPPLRSVLKKRDRP